MSIQVSTRTSFSHFFYTLFPHPAFHKKYLAAKKIKIYDILVFVKEKKMSEKVRSCARKTGIPVFIAKYYIQKANTFSSFSFECNRKRIFVFQKEALFS